MKSPGRGSHTVVDVKLLFLLAAVGAALAIAAAAAAAPPEQLLGTWTRVVAGTKWTLTIGKEKSSVRSAAGRTLRGTVIPASATLVHLELGAKADLYGWRRAANTVVFIFKHDQNRERAAILTGTWKSLRG
jgi:hypothetical protein